MTFAYSSVQHRKLKFNESILEFLGPSEENIIRVFQTNENVAIDSSDDHTFDVPIRRSWFCPYASRNRSRLRPLSEPHSTFPYIPVACVCLLETPSSDGLFLTQRRWEMRSYPGSWVPPGGHCDASELIAVTAIRELCEELGLDLALFGCDGHIFPVTSLLPLCAWEAAYPQHSQPQSHQLVIYYVCKWPRESKAQHNLDRHGLPILKLQKDEVASAVCLPLSVLRLLVEDWICSERYWKDNRTSIFELGSTPLLPTAKTISEMNDSVWRWSEESKSWHFTPFSNLICGLSNTGLKKTPTSLTLGTLYAISKYLAWRDTSLSN